ncbi:MAG TPA: Flp family type IVb pilin [Arenicellales bacterium]|nr:Flp family type IVb pilin [Arenicellales bacterium]
MKTRIHSQHGASLIEYVLIVAVIALVVFIGGSVVGDKIKEIFDETSTALETADDGGSGGAAD